MNTTALFMNVRVRSLKSTDKIKTALVCLTFEFLECAFTVINWCRARSGSHFVCKQYVNMMPGGAAACRAFHAAALQA